MRRAGVAGRAMAAAAALCLLPLLAAAQTCPAVPATGPALYGFDVVAEYPHDAHAFTQGLQFDTVCKRKAGTCKEVLWESTGMYGASSVRMVHLDSGNVERKTAMDQQWFGEGLARHGNRLYQITWLTNKGFVYSLPDLKQVGTFTTPLRDGWGITAQGSQLVLSDGSHNLVWVDPANNFKTVRKVKVTDGDRSIGYLNELEYINGEIWANIWQTDCIARICPDTGVVTGWVLLHGLRSSLAQRNLASVPMDVLNGIAWDVQRKRLFVTGKYWPRLFEITTKPLQANARTKQLVESCYIHD